MRKFIRYILGRISPASIQRYPGANITGPLEYVRVGERVTFGGNVTLHATTRIVIGSDTMIARGVTIVTATHDHNNHPMWLERVDRPIEIGNHVWIGVNAILLPGVRVGDFAVIGAGAVVTAHVPQAAIVVGSPARIVGFRKLGDKVTAAVPVERYPGVARPEGFLPDERECKPPTTPRRDYIG
jgi:maltose O-acetyltransferase